MGQNGGCPPVTELKKALEYSIFAVERSSISITIHCHTKISDDIEEGVKGSLVPNKENPRWPATVMKVTMKYRWKKKHLSWNFRSV